MTSKTNDSDMALQECTGEPVDLVACLRRKVIALERELEQAYRCACHDELTGLPNRSLLQDRLDQAIVQAERHRVQVGLLFLDLDGFKAVNDRFGHLMGDELLRQAAGRILESIRKGDTACRYGGDEFVILLAEVDGKRSAMELARKLRDRLTRPYAVDGALVEISASIGLAVYPSDGCSHDDLLRRADITMYLAKARNNTPVTIRTEP